MVDNPQKEGYTSGSTSTPLSHYCQLSDYNSTRPTAGLQLVRYGSGLLDIPMDTANINRKHNLSFISLVLSPDPMTSQGGEKRMGLFG